MSGKLQADPLFQGLTRPPMLFGVSYMYFVLNSSICMLFYINTASFVILLLVFPMVHGIGYLVCLKEPRAIEITQTKLSTCPPTFNRSFHGYTNSYDPY